jgi:XRE family transcriptional regulator, regulator of sulfur utilization
MRKPTALTQRFGARVKKLRQDRGWSQKELAAATSDELDQAFISRLETGSVEPGLGTVQTLAAALGVTMAELLDGIP